MKRDDVVVIDGTEYTCHDLWPGDYFVLRETQSPHNFNSIRILGYKEIEELRAQGRLISGPKGIPIKGGSTDCFHHWEKAPCFQFIDEFCSRCGARKRLDWKVVGDTKKKT